MSFPTLRDFRRIPHRSRSPLRKLGVIQARHGKALHALAKEFGIGIRTWLRLQACGGCQALGQQPQPGRPPCLSHDPMQMILATLRDKSPDQLQFEFACRSLQIVRPGILDQFQVQLSLATVRRVLRRLGLTRSALSSGPPSRTPPRCGLGSQPPTPSSPPTCRSREPCCSGPAGPRTTTGALRGPPGAGRLSSSPRGRGSGCTGCPRAVPREQSTPGSIPEPLPQLRGKSSCSGFRARRMLGRLT